jgi:hypothetical protein
MPVKALRDFSQWENQLIPGANSYSTQGKYKRRQNNARLSALALVSLKKTGTL